LDPIFLGVKVKRQLAFMAKEELFRVKLLGRLKKNSARFQLPVEKGIPGGGVCH
jgi:hypothetical protein